MELEIKHLNQYYGKKQVLKDINLTISAGMFGLLGRNGAGKTTLMKTIATLLPVREGSIILNDISISRKKEIREMIGYLPQDFSMYGNMTVYQAMDYLAVLSELTKKQRKERIPQLLNQVNLRHHQNLKIKAMSGGMKRRLGIAQALLNDPKLLVVDEPTAGLDPEERLRFRNLLAEISEEKIVLLSTHIAADIEAVAENIAVMNQGCLLFVGSVEEFIHPAEGKIFSVEIPRSEMAEVKKQVQIIAIQQDGMNTKIRFINEEDTAIMKHPLVIAEQPTLEDAYLYLLSKEGCDTNEASI